MKLANRKANVRTKCRVIWAKRFSHCCENAQQWENLRNKNNRVKKFTLQKCGEKLREAARKSKSAWFGSKCQPKWQAREHRRLFAARKQKTGGNADSGEKSPFLPAFFFQKAWCAAAQCLKAKARWKCFFIRKHSIRLYEVSFGQSICSGLLKECTLGNAECIKKQ